MSDASPFLFLFLGFLALVLIVAWIVLPVAIIGTKPILRRILTEAERTNQILERTQKQLHDDLGAVHAQIAEGQVAPRPTRPPATF